jgi:hypothetical protein
VQFGQGLHQLGVALALRRRQPGTAAHAVEVLPLQQAQRLRVQAQRGAAFVQRIQPQEEGGVGVDRAVVRRSQRVRAAALTAPGCQRHAAWSPASALHAGGAAARRKACAWRGRRFYSGIRGLHSS